jgi:cation diffusion facilitator family transporter
MASKKSVVLAALIANGAIAILKFMGYLLTQSPSMLSETYHSISDTGNQVFLLFCIRFSGREATDKHPFGYGKAQFFYSFLVSVLLFGIAGWESARHGYHKVEKALSGEKAHGGAEAMQTFMGFEFPKVWVNYVVLIGAFGFEAWALYKANNGMQKQMKEYGWETYREAFRKTSDSTTLTAFTEDLVALLGIVFAFVGIVLTQITGNDLYDAVAALLIGFLLMGFALALAWENKRLLIGEGFPADRQQEIRKHLADSDGVAEIIDLRTVYIGPERALVTVDVAFENGLTTEEIDDRITSMIGSLKEFDSDVERVYIEPQV